MLIILLGVLIWSGINPAKGGIWFFEVIPGVVLIIYLIATYRKFPLSPITYCFVFLAAIIMFIGGHYTYGGMPLFDQLKKVFDLSRNHFDRVGHFFQGTVITAFLLEITTRNHIIQKKYIPIFVVACSLAFSAGFEIFEFLIGRIFSSNLEEFLGTQGDIWDSHWDMVCALAGSLFFLLVFRKKQQQQFQQIKKTPNTDFD